MARRGRKPIVKKFRTFNGKRYEIVASYWHKELATKAAKGLRKQGRHARVVRVATGGGKYYYSVYVRLLK